MGKFEYIKEKQYIKISQRENTNYLQRTSHHIDGRFLNTNNGSQKRVEQYL